jgi:hypothetical protein
MRMLALLCIVAACGKPLCPVEHPTYGAHVLLASLRRTACLGQCPVYTVTIFRDGLVEYEGESFVKAAGKVSAQLDRAQLVAIDELFARNGYLVLGDAYDDHGVMDFPWAYTSYRPSGCSTKSIAHYYGDPDAPRALVVIEDGLDRIVDIEQWIGTDDERRAMARRTP